MKLKMCGDRLSDLLTDVIENILMRIPIHEAVKTSLLASNWRYKWTTITKLVFNEDLVKNKKLDMMGLQHVVKFVTHTLFLHKGPIHRFELSISALSSCPDVYNWILYLSRNRVEELILDFSAGNYWRMPSGLFNCENLTLLELSRCILHRPSNFQGFSSLKCLILDQIEGLQQDIEFLISSCPLVETLALSYIDSSDLHIDAPTLKCLTLEGGFKDINIVNTPVLTSIKVDMHFSFDVSEHQLLVHQSNFDKFLGAMPLLGRLVGNNYFAKYMSVGLDFKQVSVSCNHLALIELYLVTFEDIDEMNAVSCLLLSSPILHTLVVSVCGLLDESESMQEVKWDIENFPKGNLENLRHVKFTDMLGNPNEFLFVQFLLDRSPILEKLKISTDNYLEAEERNKCLSSCLGCVVFLLELKSKFFKNLRNDLISFYTVS